RQPPLVPPSSGPPSRGFCDREHGHQRRDGSPRRQGEGARRSRSRSGRGDPGDRRDHPRRNESPRTKGSGLRGAPDGSEPCPPHRTRGRPPSPRPARLRRASVELRGETDRSRGRREHVRLDRSSLQDGGSDPRRGREVIRRPSGFPRGGEDRMKGRAHKIRPTLGERAPSPASLLIVDAAELLTLRGAEGPRTHEAAQDLGIIEDGAVYSEGARLVDVGTTDEAKSGYGLRTDDELKILRAIAAAGHAAEIDVVPTFLGAHAVPPEFQTRPEAYVDLVREEMLPAIAANRLADFCDAFVDRG